MDFCFILLAIAPVWGWGPDGHQIVADIATSMFTDDVSSKANSVLGGKPLSYYAPLPDDWDHNPAGQWAKACHYLTVSQQGVIDEQDDCGDYCVLNCLRNSTENLKRRLMDCSGAPPAFSHVSGEYPTPCDLEFVTHYMGDIHQPFHVDFDRGDLGGNRISVTGSYTGGARNLHAVWDSGLIKRYMRDQGWSWQDFSDDLKQGITPDVVATLTGSGVEDYDSWAKESLDLSDGIASSYQMQGNRAVIDQDYYTKSIPLIRQRLLAAGVRLGTLVNAALASNAMPRASFRAIRPSFSASSYVKLPSEPAPTAPPKLGIHARPSLKFYSTLVNQKAYRVLAVAKFLGAQIESITSDASDSFGQTPVLNVRELPLETSFNVTDSNNIAQYLLDSIRSPISVQLSGADRDPRTRANIGNWLGLTYEVEKNYAAWIYPVMGRAPLDINALSKSKAYFAQFMPTLESLLTDNYLGGDEFSFADISLASSLLPLYKFVWDLSYRAKSPLATAWFERVVTSPAYLAVLEEREPTLLTADKKFKFCVQEPAIVQQEDAKAVEAGKRAAAFAAVNAHVRDNMVIGIGSGSTVVYAAERVGQLVASGWNLTAVASSFQAQELLTNNNIPATDLSHHSKLDVVIDGADQFAVGSLDLLKGGGGALLQEKIVGSSTDNFIIIADARKYATFLGDPTRPWKNGVPIEVLPLSYVPVIEKIKLLQGSPVLRMAGVVKAGPVVTDNGNFILDVQFPWSKSLDLATLDTKLHAIPGVIGTGLFLSMAKEVFIGDADGKVSRFVVGKPAATEKSATTAVRATAAARTTTTAGATTAAHATTTADTTTAPHAQSVISPLLEYLHIEQEFPSSDVATFRSLQEFVTQVENHGPNLYGFLTLDVDLSSLAFDFFMQLNLQGSFFFGCVFPKSITDHYLFHQGAKILKNPGSLPFRPFRAYMYRVPELQEDDIGIYKWSQNSNGNHLTHLYTATHDDNVVAHLKDYNKGKYLVGVMGGHAMKRADPDFKEIAKLCRDLARRNFVIVTGGGPGAMEAANYGAYMSSFSDADFETGYQMLQVGNDQYKNEYENSKAADSVLAKFGPRDDSLSLGVATWVYGHEPFNRFTAWTAKLFSNAIREDILLAVLNNGVIIAPGAAGTRQEIFQDATANSYADEKKTFSRPQIYWKSFWQNNGLFPLHLSIAQAEDKKNNKTNGWSTRLFTNLEDSKIIQILEDYREQIVKRKPGAFNHDLRWETKTEGPAGPGVKTCSNQDPEFMSGIGVHSRTFSFSDVQYMAVESALEAAKNAKFVLDTQANPGFVGRERTALLTYVDLPSLAAQVSSELGVLVQAYPFTTDYSKTMSGLLSSVLNLKDGSKKLITFYRNILSTHNGFLNVTGHGRGELTPKFFLTVDSSDRIVSTAIGRIEKQFDEAVVRDQLDGRFLASVSTLMAQARAKGASKQALLPDEDVSLKAAYQLLKSGANLPSSYKSLGLPGHRDDTQTYLFVTDPGPGHIEVTTKDNRLMYGVTVHTEYIDRDSITDKAIVEPYRLPAHVYAARVRLHVGNQAPCSCFIGRPTFEGLDYLADLQNVTYKGSKLDLFGVDELKTVHMTASACTAMFTNGIADAKIAIEKMTDKQSIDFMKGVVANTLRDQHRQYFSAAFNLFTNITLSDGTVVSEKMALARLAIRIAKEGGFDKVTWDGASNRIPSLPILGTLSFEELTDLVHEAHEQGLITYISAGMEKEQVPDAVYTGVDGIGIGTSLHYVDKNKVLGALKPAYVLEVLQTRTDAAQTTRGKAAQLLAKLDWDYYEKSLEQSHEQVRLALYKAVRAKDEATQKQILDSIQFGATPSCDGHKLWDRTHRLLAAKKPLLAQQFGDKWEAQRAILAEWSDKGDLARVNAFLSKLDCPSGEKCPAM